MVLLCPLSLLHFLISFLLFQVTPFFNASARYNRMLSGSSSWAKYEWPRIRGVNTKTLRLMMHHSVTVTSCSRCSDWRTFCRLIMWQDTTRTGPQHSASTRPSCSSTSPSSCSTASTRTRWRSQQVGMSLRRIFILSFIRRKIGASFIVNTKLSDKHSFQLFLSDMFLALTWRDHRLRLPGGNCPH